MKKQLKQTFQNLTLQDEVMGCFFNTPTFCKFKQPIYNQIINTLKKKTDYNGILKLRQAKLILGLCYNVPKRFQNKFIEDMQKESLLKRENQHHIKILI